MTYFHIQSNNLAHFILGIKIMVLALLNVRNKNTIFLCTFFAIIILGCKIYRFVETANYKNCTFDKLTFVNYYSSELGI